MTLPESVPSMIDLQRLIETRKRLAAELVSHRNADGWWVGHLSDSALSTATALSALALVDQNKEGQSSSHEESINSGIKFLESSQNPDGGWGDSDRSLSNIATTFLVLSSLHLTGVAKTDPKLLDRAQHYINSQGGLTSLRDRYGKDRTFVVPILANAALAKLVPWSQVKSLPFELATLPHWFFKFLNLPVVSYAIPALVAVGQLKYFHRKPLNPITRFLRRASVKKSLERLEVMQPESGGFLEATPLTAFVTMSLASTGRVGDPVVQRGVRFLEHSQRENGAWPIDENLACWLSTQAIAALPFDGEIDTGEIPLHWILSCQHRRRNPFTGAAGGGWGWTDLSGAVPDVDDTASALLALARCQKYGWTADADGTEIIDAAAEAVRWLLDIQNSDGGWPTFCRGWGRMPFDRSTNDLTAHALRALRSWRGLAPSRVDMAVRRGFEFLEKNARSDSAWEPLWFGNESQPNESNPVYGTSKVLAAYRDFDRLDSRPAREAIAWLISNQNRDGGFGGDPDSGSSVEETALAIEALAPVSTSPAMRPVFNRAIQWLLDALDKNEHHRAKPIGLYFSKLWYYEDLYPLIFATAALTRAVDVFQKQESK
jgi:squalene-hopene/tetraprenyl-beta-curcumene cyclase